MAIGTADVGGKIILGDGNGVPGGRIICNLTQPATTDDAGTEQVVAQQVEYVIDSDGRVGHLDSNGDFVAGFSIAANSVMTPADTRWIVQIRPDNQAGWRETWSTVVGAIDIGNIQRG